MFKFFKVPAPSEDNSSTFSTETNRLQKYIQSQSMQDMVQITSDISPEVRHMIGMNVQALMGYLPSAEFTTTIMSSKESLQNLLASAMLTGFFMHAMEYRMLMDELFETDKNASKESAVQTESQLQSPDILFQHPPVDESVPSDTPEGSGPGDFLSKTELIEQLAGESPLNISLEINTDVDLDALLKELRFIKDRQETEEELSDH